MNALREPAYARRSTPAMMRGSASGIALVAGLIAVLGCLFAPTVDFGQWAPYRVPLVRLGTAGAPCRGTRVTECPFPGHPCLSDIEPGAVVAAVTTLTSGGAR